MINDSNTVHMYPPNPFRIDHSEEQAVELLTQHLQQRLRVYRGYSDIVVFCIGTDRSTGDALGPIVGSHLERMYPSNVSIYGTLDSPVHAVNLQETIDYVKKKHTNPLIIAIDACLGQLNSVGKITVAHGPIKPGAGVKKQLPEVGTFHITGIVNIGGFMEYFVLQNTRLSVVMKMSEIIATSLYSAIVHIKESPYRYMPNIGNRSSLYQSASE
ncbi:spore protease YyaC [Aneurinibacillus thermoaerophilus]|uniref:Putative sporulation protein YyaC n=1 Tax=Aneurinibacillus thermoaerophilus TaxID=143495 RepID=A0A1G8DDX6_ANETH|nr:MULTISPECIES: spore protease YyaC [Aneurinibacillus]AMA71466.1 sporulation protein [Aneurinibacillus sp. XH2]MED0675360.1 spore protease YyaC [Aneurinibacillus thermoaerophilus]MED0679129.1 spore protease YyaC [Aneurinibacillus thermoaerophilus]MED0757451.1 spore protease YyaC [Aneurinibacillus thermoaerophilus]MED0759190.1 spore protease YyaC [Aneurinibacillus thermoaerophilus]